MPAVLCNSGGNVKRHAGSTSRMTRFLADFVAGHGWRSFSASGVVLWLKDSVDGRAGQDLAAELAEIQGDCDQLTAWLAGLRGQFALAAEGSDWAVAAVDRIRSTPLFFTSDPIRIGAHAPSMVRSGMDWNPVGCLSVAMSGYTIGGDTLYRQLRQLRAGEALVATKGGGLRTIRYHVYRPWLVRERPYAEMTEELGELTLDILRRLIDFAGGRPIAIPLSAGLDSRLIASGLVHLGYRNLVTFAYGQAGNAEAHASRRIAERLGVKWTFVPYTHSGQRAYFSSDLHRRYMAFADSCSSSPFMQDLPVLSHLRANNWLPADAVIVNGNSGDYISGGHVPAAAVSEQPATAEQRWAALYAAYGKKHLGLWDSLKNPANLTAIETRLKDELLELGLAPGNPTTDHGLYELLEFQDRQCKYVISGQRIYDFLDLAWRLPLWDDDYLDFWQAIPAQAKMGQRLYRDMLLQRNWGNVWRDMPANRKWVSPRWIVPFRLAAKLAHLPLGRAAWHGFERQYLHYWMSPTCNYAAFPYGKVAMDRRGHRNGIAFQNALYLSAKGLDYSGSPMTSELSPTKDPAR